MNVKKCIGGYANFLVLSFILVLSLMCSNPKIFASGTVFATGTPNQTVAIQEEGAPLARAVSSWSVVDLILTIAAVALSSINFITSNEELTAIGRRITLKTRPIGTVLGAIALVTFILTQNLGGKMVVTDKWTFLLSVLAAAQIFNNSATFILQRQS